MSEQEQLSKKVNKIAKKLASIIAEEDLSLAEAITVLSIILEYYIDELDAKVETEEEKQVMKWFRQKIANKILGNR
jgi:hypothetical protein